MYLDPVCPFCRMVSGKQPCCRLYEDARTLVFLVGSPAAHGHCVVIPKAHFADIYVMTDDALAAVMSTARHVARALQDALATSELDIVQSNRTASRATRHFHVNVVPRRTVDDLDLTGLVAWRAGQESERLAATLRRRF